MISGSRPRPRANMTDDRGMRKMLTACGCALLCAGLMTVIVSGSHPMGIMFPIGGSLLAWSGSMP